MRAVFYENLPATSVGTRRYSMCENKVSTKPGWASDHPDLLQRHPLTESIGGTAVNYRDFERLA